MAKAKQKAAAITCFPSSVEDELVNFAVAQIALERTDGAPLDIPGDWVVRKLITAGKIAYWQTNDESVRGYYNAHRIGQRDRYGLPTMIVMSTDATGSAPFSVPAYDNGTGAGAVIIRANALGLPPLVTIARYASVIRALDTATNANIIASMRSQILGGVDANTIDEILANSYDGLPTAVAQDVLDQLRSVDVSVDFRADRLHALRQTIYADALKHLGGISSVQYKAERVQSAEVEAHAAETIDFVYQMIDQANADMGRGNVPYRLKYRGYGVLYDVDVDNETDHDDTDKEVRLDEQQA